MAQRLKDPVSAHFHPLASFSAPEHRPLGAEVVLPDLEPLLSKVCLPRRKLLEVFARSAPPGWEPPADTRAADFLLQAVRLLARGLPQSDGTIPLLRFVEQLTQQVTGPPADRLQAWLVDTANKLGVPARMPGTGKPASPACSEASPCHLLVQVAPLTTRPG